MSRNYKELQDAVLDHQLNRTKYLGSVKRWLNEGQDKFSRHIDARSMFTPIDFETVMGENAYELPSDFLRVVEDGVGNATDPNDWLIFERIELRDFDEMPEADGTPTAYVIAGDVLYLYPTPEAVYDIALIYYRKATPMEDDSSTPEIPEDYWDLLEYYALQRAYERENDYTAAQYWEQRWVTGLERARGQLQYDTHDGSVLVGGTWEEMERVARGGGGSGRAATTVVTEGAPVGGNGGGGGNGEPPPPGTDEGFGDGTFGDGTFGGD